MIDVAYSKLLPTGADGSAAATATAADWDKEINGRILAVAVNLTNQPNTVDVTIPHPNAPASNLLALTNMSADVYHVPAKYGVDNAGSGLASNVTPEKFCAKGYPLWTIAQGDAGATKYIEIWVWFER